MNESKLEKVNDPISFPVPMGFNNYRSVRKPTINVGAGVLRSMSINYPVARACITYRKRQITALDWDIVPIEEDDAGTDEVKEFFKSPGGFKTRLRELLDNIVEDLLVLDALALEKERAFGGNLLSLIPVDASTILLLVDDQGRTPQPPQIAYRQIIRGETIAEMTTDDMIYEVMNPRTNTPYGLSPLESLVLTVSSALQAGVFNNEYLSEGNIPEGFLTLPKEMVASTEQLKTMQSYWDSMMRNPAMMSKLKIIPEGSSYTASKKPEDMSFEKFELWLLQLTCSMFGVPPQNIGFTQEVNKATAEQQDEIAEDTSMKPTAKFIKELLDQVIQEDLGHPNLQWHWTNLEVEDEEQAARINEINIRNGIKSVDEVREQNGDEPIGVGNFIMGTPYMIGEEADMKREEERERMNEMMEKEPEEKEEKDKVIEELQKYQRFCLSRIKANKPIRKFESEILPEGVLADIDYWVRDAKSPLDVMKAFDPYLSKKGKMIHKLSKLKDEIDGFIDSRIG